MTDYLICGACLKEFPLQKITLFIQHKKLDCDDEGDDNINDPELQCNYCPQGFMTAWGLLIHAQISHNLKIFLEKASRSLLQGNKLQVKPVNEPLVSPHSNTDRALPLQTTYRHIADTIKGDSGYVKVAAKVGTVGLQQRLALSNGVLASCPPTQTAQFGSSMIVSRDLISGAKEIGGIDSTEANSQLKMTEGQLPCNQIDVVKSSTVPFGANTEDLPTENGMHNNQCGNTTPVKSLDREESNSTMGDSEKCIDENAILDVNSECCDNQGCGVTVIPGTHQNLQKCCNAVVPKKRKRHMEMKHMSYSWSSSRYARRRLLNRSVSSMKPVSSSLPKSSSIFIEVEPDPSLLDKQATDYNNCRGSTSVGGVTVSTEPVISMARATTAKVQTLTEADTKPKSLILKPGAIFSIPFTYTIPVTSGQSTFRFNPPISTVTSSVRSQGSLLSTPIGSQGSIHSGASQIDTAAMTPQTKSGGAVRGKRSLKNADRPAKYSTSKPFHCEICSMTFNQRIHLKKHIMSKHTGNKPYKCGECEYSTVERSHLKVHIRIHTGEKPFKCTYCEYATAQNSTLKIHLKRHHGGKMFRCSTCEKDFTQEQQLQGHECDHVGDGSPETKSVSEASASIVTQAEPLPFVESTTTDLQPTSTARGDNSTSPVTSPAQQSCLPDSPSLHTCTGE